MGIGKAEPFWIISRFVVGMLLVEALSKSGSIRYSPSGISLDPNFGALFSN
jgi:hypothetical protein